jgi:hypothetical protein
VSDARAHRIDLKALTVILYFDQHALIGHPQADKDVPGSGMLGRVSQRLLANMEQSQSTHLRYLIQSAFRTRQLDLGERVGAVFGCQTLESGQQTLVPQLPGPQVQYVGPDITNG